MRLLPSVTAALVVLAAAGYATADTPAIEEYSFTWVIEKIDDATVAIIKDAETTRIAITNHHDALLTVPADAVKVGDVLANTDKHFDKFRGMEKDVRQEIDAGKYTATFSNSKEFGFSVSIANKEAFGITRVTLNRKQAVAFAKHLKRSVELAKLVDERIGAAVR